MTKRRIFVSFVALVLVVAFAATAVRDANLELNYIAIEGGLNDAQREDVLKTLAKGRDQIEELTDIKALLESSTWIAAADVTRRWPDSLTVRVTPERAIAYWNDDAFINDDGRVFTSPYLIPRDLAHLYGPFGSEARVMQQFQQLSKALSPSGQVIEVLVLDDRGAWELTTARGVKVQLGKDDIRDRIERFLFVVDSAGLASRLDDIEQIDTRYSNGVAVGFKEAPSALAMAKTDTSEREQRL